MSKINTIPLRTIRLFILMFLVASCFFVSGQNIYAQSADTTVELAASCEENGGNWDGATGTCEQANSNEIKADCKTEGGEQLDQSNCKIIDYVLKAINFLSALVGVVAVFSIMWAGYQYMMARDNAQAVSAAKSRITTTILALIVYMFMWVFLQWVVPGGIL